MHRTAAALSRRGNPAGVTPEKAAVVAHERGAVRPVLRYRRRRRPQSRQRAPPPLLDLDSMALCPFGAPATARAPIRPALPLGGTYSFGTEAPELDPPLRPRPMAAPLHRRGPLRHVARGRDPGRRGLGEARGRPRRRRRRGPGAGHRRRRRGRGARAGHRPRRRRLRGRRPGVGRRPRRGVGPLRADVERRRRHRPVGDPGPGLRPPARGGRRARGGDRGAGPASSATRRWSGGPTASTPSRPPSAPSSRSGRSRSAATASGWPGPGPRSRSASSPGPSAPTPTSIPRSRRSCASGSA